MSQDTGIIDPTLDNTSHKKLGQEIDEILSYVENKQSSFLFKLYSQDDIDVFMGRKVMETDWFPDPENGDKRSGSKTWNGVEYWVYVEWGIILSVEQQEWAKEWMDLAITGFFITGGRDSGKSYLGALFVLWAMVFLNEIYPNFLVMLFAGSKDQSETVYEEHIIPGIIDSKNMKKLLSKYDPIWDQVTERRHAAVKNVELKLLNGARIKVNPTSTKAARSKHPDILWVDEAVEAEDVRKGKVISGARSSLTAGHLMRTLATSTVHKNPTGWFARNVRKAMSVMKRGGAKTIFTVNLSRSGIKSRPWVGEEEMLKELALKLDDDSINEDAEFFGLIAGGSGDVYNQVNIIKMLKKTKRPKFNKDNRIVFAHDPGFGTSLYGFTVWQLTEIDWELIDGEFWRKGDPIEILEKIKKYVEKYGEGEHACDAAATVTIKYLQHEGYDVHSFQLGAKPPEWSDMLPDEKERYNSDAKTIADNLINEKLSQGRLKVHPGTGFAKPLYKTKDEPAITSGALLIEQMETQMINETTNKPEKGHDDMNDSMRFMALEAEFGGPLGQLVPAGKMNF